MRRVPSTSSTVKKKSGTNTLSESFAVESNTTTEPAGCSIFTRAASNKASKRSCVVTVRHYQQSLIPELTIRMRRSRSRRHARRLRTLRPPARTKIPRLTYCSRSCASGMLQAMDASSVNYSEVDTTKSREQVVKTIGVQPSNPNE